MKRHPLLADMDVLAPVKENVTGPARNHVKEHVRVNVRKLVSEDATQNVRKPANPLVPAVAKGHAMAVENPPFGVIFSDDSEI